VPEEHGGDEQRENRFHGVQCKVIAPRIL